VEAGAWGGQRVNDDVGTSDQLQPDVSVDGLGVTHSVWASTGRIYSSRLPASGTNWSPSQAIDDGPSGARSYPAVSSDALGNAYAVWVDRRNGRDDIYFSKRNVATGAWGANVRINTSTTFTNQSFPAIAVGGDGSAIAVWYRKVGNNKFHIYSARLPAGGSSWGPEIKVSVDQSLQKQASKVALGPDGTAYAIWMQPSSGDADIWLATLQPGSSTWSGHTEISDDPGTSFQGAADIAVDGSGNIFVAWDDWRASPHQLRVRRRPAGGSWGSSSIVAADGANTPSLSAGADGRVILTWYDGLNALFPNVHVSEYDPSTGSWTSPQQLNQDGGTKPASSPAAALGPDRAVVVWQSGTNVSGDYDYDVLASSKPLAGTGTDSFSYGYDRLYRLTSVTNPGDDAAYSYDPVGNRLTKTLGSTSTTYTYDRADRLASAGGSSVSVSAVGTTTARGADTFAYDQANRLTSATVAGVTENSAYDGDGVRFSRQVGGGPLTRSVTDPAAGLPVTLDDGSRTYVWGFGLAYAVAGSSIEVRASRPTPRASPISRPASYEPSVGRSMSRDPFPGFVAGPLTLNRNGARPCSTCSCRAGSGGRRSPCPSRRPASRARVCHAGLVHRRLPRPPTERRSA